MRTRVTGRVRSDAAAELSGLVRSPSRPRVLWTHNDSGDRARLLAVRDDGRLLADVTVSGATNSDWEDIATDGSSLLVADIGDNFDRRSSVSVYRFAEPSVGERSATSTAPAERIELRYPGGPRDAEALLVDPAGGKLVIVEKRFDGRAGIYVADRPAAGGPTTLRRGGRLSLRPGEAVTAGDVSADGRTIALRSYTRLFAWTRRPGESVAEALRRRPCSADAELLREGQGEALALSRNGATAYTVPEGRRPAIRAYAPG
ncbi:MAG: hypothetical protein ACR2LK_11330 [Solirubrobacteraceae bacterium]